MNFQTFRDSLCAKKLTILVLLTFVFQFLYPTIAYALTGGPDSPEFSNFKSVSSSEHVNLSSGDFVYSLPVLDIPGPDGGGYSMALSYNSNISAEQEASWVGLGWTLNPGAINRNKRGLPDDYKEGEVDMYNKTRPNWSVSGTKYLGNIEAFGIDAINFSKSLRFNNYKGLHHSSSFGLTTKALGIPLNLGVNNNQDGFTFSASVNPLSKMKNVIEGMDIKLGWDPAESLVKNLMKNASSQSFGVATFGISGNFPTTFTKYSGFAFNFSTSFQLNPSILPAGAEAGFQTGFNMYFNQYYLTNKGYGYMHPPANNQDMSGVLMDYFVEKETIYNKRDKYIGIPFSNYDVFHVSGEGISGGFRAYPSQYGHYRPSKPGGGESKFNILNLGWEPMAGANVGVGLDVGTGVQKTTIDEWGNAESFGDEFIFRFNNDMGGNINFNNSTELETAALEAMNNVPGAKKVQARDGSIFFTNGERNHLEPQSTGRKKYIEFHTRHDLDMLPQNKLYNKELNASDLPTDVDDESIVEFRIHKENGQRYDYGMPVYVRNETDISVSIDDDHTVIDQHLAFRHLGLCKDLNNKYYIKDESLTGHSHRTVRGRIEKTPYSKTFLLTSITGTGYVDVNNNGPSIEDFGAWTKFNYRKKYGKSGKWYRYRKPFNGLLYKRNQISDPKDDVGTVLTGEKEVAYLQSVETKTHIAFFVTSGFVNNTSYNFEGGSGKRLDGYGAPTLNASGDPAANSTQSVRGNTSLEKLERIILFAKKRPDKPVKTIHFEYDYSLVGNVPNNENSNYDYRNLSSPGNQNSGKLTLKRVWFESEGTKPVEISPYEFSYAYKHSSQVKAGKVYFTPYDNIPGSAQNPAYSSNFLGPWQNNKPYGKARNQKKIPWIYQGKIPAQKTSAPSDWRNAITDADHLFDPAAWRLKQIKLPSGGTIHAQYEQKTYRYVQDKKAMAMTSLGNYSDPSPQQSSLPWFNINVRDLGCDPSNQEQVEALADTIRNCYGVKPGSEYSGKKMYYKMLYSFKNSLAGLDNKTSEYITGYANIKQVDVVSDNENYTVRITLGQSGDDYTLTPRTGCYDYVVNNRQGKINSQGVDPTYEAVFDQAIANAANKSQDRLPQNSDPEKIEAKLIQSGIALSSMIAMTADPRVISMNKSSFTVCRKLNPALSFFKLPLLQGKRGGGVRVKRIITYDHGLENRDAVVYGKEYRYVLDDGKTTSGVATNEPRAIREENPFVAYLARKSQSAYNRLTVGKDTKQMEGPLGESILPGPSVTHSRVVVENIHTGKTGTGFSVNEFYTTKDFPYGRYYPEKTIYDEDLNKDISLSDVTGQGMDYSILSDNTQTDKLPINTQLINMNIQKVWMAQGYRFIINTMNGRKKQMASYSGTYEPPDGITRTSDTEFKHLVAFSKYKYFQPGRKIPVLSWNGDKGTYQKEYATPGKDMEMAVEKKMLRDHTFDMSVELDISAGISFLPPIYITGIPSINYSNSVVATHATTKVLRYPAILKSITRYEDGITTKTDFLAFEKATGQPILKRTTEAYHGLTLFSSDEEYESYYYTFDFPTNWIYPNTGQKAIQSENTNQLNLSCFQLKTYGDSTALPGPGWFTYSNPTMQFNLKQVVNLEIQTFNNTWNGSWENQKINDVYGTSAYTDQLNEIWRPISSYIYKSDTVVSDASKSTYETGIYDVAAMFNWQKGQGISQNDDWIKVSELTKYSPHGKPLEEEDALNIPSTVLYGEQYGFHTPVITAQNAEYETVYFNDYENGRGNQSNKSHSGDYSMSMLASRKLVEGVFITPQLKDRGGLVQVWVQPYDSTQLENQLSATVSGGQSVSVPLEVVATSGAWSLCRGMIPKDDLQSFSSGEELIVHLENITGNTLYIDDVRFQPADAKGNCFVYDDKTLKLISTFDDQHFGLFYQYNEEGKLVRKIKETERGVKTISESHYHKPKTAR